MKAAPTHLYPNRRSINGLDRAGLQPDVMAERLLFWTIALIPLWWIIGIQVIVYPLVGWYLFYRSLHRPVSVRYTFGWNMWWLYTGIWLFSILLNLARGTAEVGRSITALGSIFGVWMLTVIVWYAVRRLGIRYHVIIRAICVVGFCQLVAVLLGEAYLYATGSVLRTQSLIVTLVPSMPARIFFEATFYGFERLTWDADPVTRLKSFYYWAPLAGTMSLFICLAAMAERKRFWQVTSFLGGLVTIWLAAARAAQVGVVLSILVAIWFGGGRGRKALLWSLVPLGMFSPIILTQLYLYFFKYRTDSTEGRLALYEETYKAFERLPLFGYGSQGRSNVLDVPLGSHSQILSTLYQTGVVGSFVLVVAWIAISISLLRLVCKQPSLSPMLGAWLGLTLVMPTGELAAASVTVFSLAAWIGGAWNWADRMSVMAQQPWLPNTQIAEPPTPWESLQRWWKGSGPVHRL